MDDIPDLSAIDEVADPTYDTVPTFDELFRHAAENHQLDFLEILDARGTIVSSAQWPAKFGYPEPAFESLSASNDQRPFLKLEELQDSTALGFFAARAIHVGDRSVYVVGGQRLDKNFLLALDLPADTRVLLYQNRGDHFSAELLLDPAGSSTAVCLLTVIARRWSSDSIHQLSSWKFQ